MRSRRKLNNPEKIQLSLSYLLQVTIAVASFIAFIKADWLVLFVSLLSLITTFIPALLGRSYKLHLPVEFELAIILFIYASIFLGTVVGFYSKFWWWDVLLHGTSGIVMGFAGFLILYTLYASGKLNTTPLILVTFAFSFGLAYGALWEIFEFTMDSVFGTSMQKYGLRDTMWDLIMDSGGALLTSTLGYMYILRYKKGLGLFNRLIKKFLDKNPRLTK